MTAGGELEEVEGGDGAGLDAGDVAEALVELATVGLGVEDDEGSAALAEAAASKLTLTSAELAGLLDLLELGTGADGGQEGDGVGGLGDGVTADEGGVDDEGNLGDLGDLVAARQEEGSDGGGGEGGAGGISPGGEFLFSPCSTISLKNVGLH